MSNHMSKCWVFSGLVLISLLLNSIFSQLPWMPSSTVRFLDPVPQPRSQFLRMLNDTSLVTSTEMPSTMPPQNCTAWTSIVFIKTHKTGSTTLQTIVNRYGFFNELSFVFNVRSSKNGHFFTMPSVMSGEKPEESFLPPLNVKKGDYARYKNYDMLSQHVRYNRPQMSRFMRNDTKYITIIREPSAQWESAFEHFKFQDAFRRPVEVNEWIDTFLARPSYHRERLRFMKYDDGISGVRWFYAQNSQFYDLGLDPENGFYNETVINKTIKNLEKEFTMVLITEYFDESLLILKKELCWEFEDIAYIPKNQRQSRRTLPEEFRQKIRTFNHADVLLYHQFNQTLWRKIDEYGSTFEADLAYFRQLKSHLFEECGNEKPIVKKIGGHRPYKRVEFSPKTNATLFCTTLAEYKGTLFNRVFDRQNPTKKKANKKTLKKKKHVARVRNM